MSNVIPLRANATHHTPPDSLRSDCERLMRRLVREGRTPVDEMRMLADFLDCVIIMSEARK